MPAATCLLLLASLLPALLLASPGQPWTTEETLIVKAKLTELEVKEKLESEEIALLKEAIGKGVDISDDTSLEEELEAIKKLLEDDEDELQSSESSSQTSGDSANATTEGGDDDDDDEW